MRKIKFYVLTTFAFSVGFLSLIPTMLASMLYLASEAIAQAAIKYEEDA